MSTLEFHQFPYMSDNYGVLVHSPSTGDTACVDAGESEAVLDALQQTGWKLSQIWITHHHHDHTGGLKDLKQATGAAVIGPRIQSQPIAGIDEKVGQDDHFKFGDSEVHVMHTPGHTLDMVNYYLPAEKTLFAGDTLFTMGCGKLFEGDAPTMWESLNKIMKLPAETTVYCSHEYTLENGEFAIRVDPDKLALKNRIDAAKALRANDKATVPSTLAEELATNPFLRASDVGIRKALGMADASDLEVFTELRIQRG